MEITKSLQAIGIRFCRILKGTKKPFEKDWTNKPYSKEEIEEYLSTGKENYGVLCGHGNIACIDCDTERLVDIIEKKLPTTYKVKTGGDGIHYYFFIPGLKNKLILSEMEDGKEIHLGEVQSHGTQVVGPGSRHPNGKNYQEINQIPITEIKLEELMSAIGEFTKASLEATENYEYEKKENSGDSINDMSVTDIWGTAGLKKQGEEYYGDHPTHGSTGHMNFWINPSKNCWKCFRCLPKDSQIITPNGVRKIQDLKIGDKVFGKEFQKNKIKNILKRIAKENIYEVNTYTPKFELTEEHPLYIASIKYKGKHLFKGNPIFSWKEVKDINPKKDFLVVPKKHKATKYLNLNKEQGYLLGWYLAEGHLPLRKDRKTNGNGVTLTLSINEEKIAKKLCKISKKEFGGTANYNIYPKRGTTIITLYSKSLRKFIEKTIRTGSSTKQLRDLIQAPMPFLKTLVKGYIEGDGGLSYDKKQQRVSSASEILIREIQTILFKLGIAARYYLDEQKNNEKAKSPKHILQWTIKPIHKSEFQDKDNLYLPIKIKQTDSNKMVYNLTTEDNTFLLPFIVHNCGTGGGPLAAIAVKEGIIQCSDARRGYLRGEKAIAAIKIAKEKYGLKQEGFSSDVKIGNIKEKDITPLKSINVIGNSLVKTRILIADISPGTNLIKGFTATCPGCGRNKITFGRFDKFCGEVFKKEIKTDGGIPCADMGRPVKIDYESISDTGYLCNGYDPIDSGGSPQFSTVFFSNDVIPQDPKKREQFESDIQTKHMIVSGKIVLLPSTKKVVDWCIDVLDFEFEEKKAKIDFKLIHKFKDIEKDDDFFKTKFIPRVWGKVLAKKIYAITLLGPFKVKLPNGVEEYGVINCMESGDPGQSKTVLFAEALEYCKEITNSKLISVENSTNRGLIGAAVKNPATGQWMIKIGQLTLCNQGFVGLDGFGKLSQDDFSQMRGIQEEHKFQINKAGSIQKECAVRMIAMSNLINTVKTYFTKHRASFDIAATTSDRGGKFSGADRRRYHHILIAGDKDTKAKEIDKHLFGKEKDNEEELKAYWDNLREYAWHLKPEDIEWDSKVVPKALIELESLRKEYFNFVLDYGILSKGGMKMFLIQLPAIAILHNSINDKNKVKVKEEHVEWLLKLYNEEFNELGLDLENQRSNYHQIAARDLIKNLDDKAREILIALKIYGSQRSIERAGVMNRTTIWRAFNKITSYDSTDWSGSKIRINYSPSLGSGSLSGFNNNQLIPDKDLDSVMKRDGTITNFGRVLIDECEYISRHGGFKSLDNETSNEVKISEGKIG